MMKEGEDMSKRRVNLRILIIFLILGMPSLVVGHLVLVSGARQDYSEVMGGYFSQGADTAQTVLISYLAASQSSGRQSGLCGAG